MDIDRTEATTRRTEMLASELSTLNGPCVGCTECKGLCRALIDALTVPHLVLSGKH